MGIGTGIGITIAIIVAIFGVRAARKSGWKPRLPRRSSGAATTPAQAQSGASSASSPPSKLGEWWSKNWAVTVWAVVIFIAVGFVVRKGYTWSAQQEEFASAKTAARVSQIEYEKQVEVNLARKLRSAIVIPAKDTTFVVVATDKGSPIYLPPRGYCTARRPVNPSHSFVVITQKGRHIDMPNTDTDLGNVQYFSLQSYGDKTTEVEIEVSKLVNNQCKTPNRGGD